MEGGGGGVGRDGQHDRERGNGSVCGKCVCISAKHGGGWGGDDSQAKLDSL